LKTLDHRLRQVVDGADLLDLARVTHRPQTLELCVMKRQTTRDGVGEQVERCDGSVVIVDVIQVDRETAHSLSDTLVPGRVVDSRVQVIHTSWVRLLSVLSAEDRGIEKHVGDVGQFVVLDLDLVSAAENGHVDRETRSVDGVVDSTSARYDPNEILVLQVLTHELSHDTETSNLDLDLPVLDVVLHGTNKHTATLAFDNRAGATKVVLDHRAALVHSGRN
jgi:hypothetical protein